MLILLVIIIIIKNFTKNDKLLRQVIKLARQSNCNWTPTQNDLVHKRTLNHLAKLALWLWIHFETRT